ncbi:MAG TPA: BTAD domain-containing putative transcriptional regulator, partial [Actinopolymorphaceae bacterium]
MTGGGTVEIRLLGEVEVRKTTASGDLVAVDPGPLRQRLIIASLALTPGVPVSQETLIDRIWDEQPPSGARAALYTYVSKLRKVLGSRALVRRRGGYVLAVDADRVDVDRFERLVALARQCADSDPGLAREHVRRALESWRGTPLSGLPGPWAEGVRQSLIGTRITAMLLASDLDLVSGRHERLVEELPTCLADYPLVEPLSVRYLRALVACGRRAEALEWYARTRERMIDELGEEPGPELQDLHLRILRRQAVAVASDHQERPADPVDAGPSWIGPRCPVREVIGREAERAELTNRLSEPRLVTVTGVGGCGKSTVALQTAEDLAAAGVVSAVVVAALGEVPTSAQVISALGSHLGAPGRNPQDLERAVASRLGVRPMLLVLDNCEHLLDGLGSVVAGLLAECRELRILVTSRQPLGVSEEVVWPLSPLPVPDVVRPDPANPAIRLFLARARDASPAFTPDTEAMRLVAKICRRLDGIPLALELAAARLRTLSVRQIHERLQRNFDLLDAETARSDPRHRTLYAVIDWSYGLLPEPARRLLAYLSVFAGRFDLDAAEAVCGDAAVPRADVTGLLAMLVDRSLVQVEEVGQDSSRFRLLLPIREFANAMLAKVENGSEDAADRHLDYWLAQVRVLDRLPTYHQRVAFASALPRDDVRKALEHGYRSGRAADAATWTAYGFELWLVDDAAVVDGETWLARAGEVAERCDPEVRALLAFHAALLLGLREDFTGLRSRIRALVGDLAKYRVREFREALASLLSSRRYLLDPSALADIPEFVRLANDPPGDMTGTVANAASVVLTTWGRWDEAEELGTRNRAFNRRSGRPDSVIRIGNDVEIALGHGDVGRARELVDQLLGRLGDVPNPLEHAPARRAIA